MMTSQGTISTPTGLTVRRSDCPINFSLEMFGDGWSLLIIRDIVYEGKRTFGEFLASDEGIARNILASRLMQLEQRGILAKKPHPSDGRKEVYELTERGLDLIPVLLDMAAWGAQHEPAAAGSTAWMADTQLGREALVERVRQTVQSGGSVFVGPRSVVGASLSAERLPG